MTTFLGPTLLLSYVDPGVGLLAWQAIVAAFVGTLFYLRKTRKLFVRRFSALFQAARRSSHNPPRPPPKQQSSGEP